MQQYLPEACLAYVEHILGLDMGTNTRLQLFFVGNVISSISEGFNPSKILGHNWDKRDDTPEVDFPEFPASKLSEHAHLQNISKRNNSKLWRAVFPNCAPVSLGEQRILVK